MQTTDTFASFRFDSAGTAVVGQVQPPRFPEEPAQPQGNVMAWAQRVVERVRAEVLGGRLRIPKQIDLTKNDAVARKAYDEMLAEPMVMTPLRVLVDAVAALDLQIIPQDETAPREQEACDFIRWAFRQVDGGLLAIIRAVAFNGLRRGWSVTEPVWEQVAIGKYAGKWSWKIFKDKDTHELDPITDEFRNLIGIRSRLKVNTIWSPDDFVVYSHLKLFQNPFGLSSLRSAYDSFVAKRVAMQLYGLHLEKWGSPFLKGTYTDEASQRAALELALTNAEANTWCSVPVGTLIEVIGATAGTPADYADFCDRCDKSMAIAIMASHLPIMEGSNKTVAGSTREQRGTTELFQWSLSAEMGALLSKALIDLVRINFPDVPPPQAVLGAVSESEVAQFLLNASTAQGLGLPLSRQQIYKRSGLESPRDPEDTLVPQPVAPLIPSPKGFAENGEQLGDPPPGPAPLTQQVAKATAHAAAVDLLGKAETEGTRRLGKAFAVR